MKQRLTTLMVLGLTALPATAFAEDAEGALNPFAGNVGNAIWTLVIFTLVVIVLGKFAWGPVLGLLKDREQFIHKALADAKHDREQAEASLRDYTEKLRQARVEADQLITTARADAERFREESRTKAKEEAAGIVKTAERQIQMETERAIGQIRHEAIDLSVMIASKLLQRNLTKEDNERLIDDALRQLGTSRH
jgi:F-type H+-transporting ATPase subunit b